MDRGDMRKDGMDETNHEKEGKMDTEMAKEDTGLAPLDETFYSDRNRSCPKPQRTSQNRRMNRSRKNREQMREKEERLPRRDKERRKIPEEDSDDESLMMEYDEQPPGKTINRSYCQQLIKEINEKSQQLLHKHLSDIQKESPIVREENNTISGNQDEMMEKEGSDNEWTDIEEERKEKKERDNNEFQEVKQILQLYEETAVNRSQQAMQKIKKKRRSKQKSHGQMEEDEGRDVTKKTSNYIVDNDGNRRVRKITGTAADTKQLKIHRESRDISIAQQAAKESSQKKILEPMGIHLDEKKKAHKEMRAGEQLGDEGINVDSRRKLDSNEQQLAHTSERNRKIDTKGLQVNEKLTACNQTIAEWQKGNIDSTDCNTTTSEASKEDRNREDQREWTDWWLQIQNMDISQEQPPTDESKNTERKRKLAEPSLMLTDRQKQSVATGDSPHTPEKRENNLWEFIETMMLESNSDDNE